jgi:hypothetical protein
MWCARWADGGFDAGVPVSPAESVVVEWPTLGVGEHEVRSGRVLSHVSRELFAEEGRYADSAVGLLGEQCYRNLMRAAAAEGNQVAFEAVYSELLAVVDADEGPDASSLLDPDTVELYERESRRRRRQAG